MGKFKIPFNRPFFAGKEIHYISQAVADGHLSGDGPYTRHSHHWLEQKLGCKRAFLTPSCTAALEMAAILCDIMPGDEVIMPSYTFVSTANAFVLRGGTPVFVDIRSDTMNIDENLIEDAITSRTRAIVPVHYAGIACDMDKIMHIAKSYDLLVIEDAAQAMLSTYKNHYLGAIGDLGCLSFHETKNIMSGEGGALLVNNKQFIERAEIIREKGTDRNKFFRGEVDKYTWVDIGSSYLPSELVGAFLYAQLERAEEILAARAKIFQQYLELLEPLEQKGFIRLPVINDECEGNAHIFYIITRSSEERIRLINYLKEKGIMAIFHYVPLHASPAGIKYGRVAGDMTNTNTLSERVLRLAIYYEMREQDVEQVAEAIKAFYGHF